VNETGSHLHFLLGDIANKEGALRRQATGPTRIRGCLCNFVSLHGYSTETGIVSYAFVVRVLWILISAFSCCLCLRKVHTIGSGHLGMKSQHTFQQGSSSVVASCLLLTLIDTETSSLAGVWELSLVASIAFLAEPRQQVQHSCAL
jgi:hypothetical protein